MILFVRGVVVEGRSFVAPPARVACPVGWRRRRVGGGGALGYIVDDRVTDKPEDVGRCGWACDSSALE